MEGVPTVRQLSLFEPVEIQLTQGYVTVVDPLDADLALLVWGADVSDKRNAIYAKRHIQQGTKKTNEYMHRVIMARIVGRPLSRSEHVDHVDLNGLNNARSNLRLANMSQNKQNCGLQSNNTSGYKGVFWNKRRDKWEAQIHVSGKKLFLGRFDDKAEANAAYCDAANRLFGEFARTEYEDQCKQSSQYRSR